MTAGFLACFALAAAAPARAGVAPVLGVDLGAPVAELERVVQAQRLTCRRAEAPSGAAVVCVGGVSAGRFQVATTYWLRAGRVDRIYQQARVALPFFSHYQSALRLWRDQIEAALGQPGVMVEEPLPAWAQGLDDAQRRRALSEGRLRVDVRWPLSGGERLTLSLRGEQGQPLLLLSAEPGTEGAEGTCSAEALVAALGTLFPPADPELRAQSARALAGCRDRRTLGPLRSALQHDGETPVRIASARALALAGDREPVLAVLAAPWAPDELRAGALDALGEAGAAPEEGELAALVQQPGAALRASLEGLAARRAVVAGAATGRVEDQVLPPSAGVVGVEAGTGTGTHTGTGTGTVGVVPGAMAMARRAGPIIDLRRPVEPAKPWVERDGTGLAIATSIAAGGLWGGGLALLAQQDGVGVVTLLGSAGAVIGGGTAWGLTRFGIRPNAAQALWFANSTGWGALAGLTIWSGSGSESDKLKYALLVGGETLGIIGGAWSARRFDFRPTETLFADSLVLGAGLGMVGGSMLLDPDGPWDVPGAAAIGVVPALLGAAVASKVIRISPDDVPLMVVTPLAAGWTGALLASGLTETALLGDARTSGGALVGLGAGYLTAAAAASFVDVSRRTMAFGSGGLLLGNALGRGIHMVASPQDERRWPLGTALGGIGLAAAGLAAGPHLHPGPSALGMTVGGGVYGSTLWALALVSGSTGQPPDARLPGGMMAGGVAAGLGGLVASQWWSPQLYHHQVAVLGAGLGIGAGLGTAKLTTGNKGLPEVVGVLAGGAAGFAGGAIVSTGARLRPPALLAGAVGGSYGLLVGSLLPTIAQESWNGGRKTDGAGWLGLSLGAAGATLGARAIDAGAGSVALVGGAGVLGIGMGAGAGWMWPVAHGRPVRIGLLAGSTTLLAAGLLAEQRLHLSQSLGPHTVGLALFGAGLGAAHGLLGGRVIEPNTNAPMAGQQLGGAVLLGTSAGLASGVLASKWVHPTANDYLGVAGASVLGHSAGLGLALALKPAPRQVPGVWPPTYYAEPPDRGERAFRLLGAAAGMGAGALVARVAPLRTPDLAAGVVGAGYGGLLGALAPTLHQDVWQDDHRTSAGMHLGVALGGAGAATAAHLTGASGAQVAVPTVAAGLGALGGLGLGGLLPGTSGQSQRVGTVVGTLSLAGASIALARPLRLTEGFGVPGSIDLSLVGGGIGWVEGMLLAGLVDPSGTYRSSSSRHQGSGMLLGTVAGTTTGFVLSRFIQPTALDKTVTLGGGALGGGLGLGVSMLATDESGRPDTAATMAGSLAGLSALALTQRWSPLEGPDFLAMPVGLAFGGLFGRLAPTLDDAQLGPLDRPAGGGLLAGLTAGSLGAVALRHVSDARAGTVGLAALGGADGALTGLGVGLLLDDEGNSRAQRIGVVAGGAAGLVMGAGLWSQLDLRGTDSAFIAGLSALGAWNGLLAPTLGHATSATVSGRQMSGGALAGIGAGTVVATALVPALEVDADLMTNAIVLDLLLTGAGAGAGALASRRLDAPVWGAMGGGAAGLLLGGALHRSIELDEKKRPLYLLASTEGLWFGAWFPYLLRERDRVTGRQVAGGVAAGVLGGAALATLASPVFEPDGHTTGAAALGSAIGASLAGGTALLAPPLHGRGGVGLLLGGTGAGLLAGGLGAPGLDLRAGAGYAAVGSMVGASEALVFAWSARAEGNADYAGAALVGAGLGSTIGMVAAANPTWTQGRLLPAAGFAGWGAWMGSFGGALINRDPHEVTLGGLAGANAGLLTGLGLLASETVEPRDFGWLSAFGAAGTVVGGGVGALFSTRTNPRPALAGLLIGPAVGLAAGALVLPQLRTIGRSAAAPIPPDRTPAATPAVAAIDQPAPPTSSADLWEAQHSPGQASIERPLASRVRRSFRISHVMPVVGAMPTGDPNAGPPPFVLGVAGLWR